MSRSRLVGKIESLLARLPKAEGKQTALCPVGGYARDGPTTHCDRGACLSRDGITRRGQRPAINQPKGELPAGGVLYLSKAPRAARMHGMDAGYDQNGACLASSSCFLLQPTAK